MRAWILAAAIILTGCATRPEMVNVLYKTGSTGTERQAALDDCRVESLQKVPNAIATRTSPGYSSPGSVQCSTAGGLTTCNNVGGVNIPAQTTSYDAHVDLRTRILDRCLVAKGFEIIQLPACSPAERAQKLQAKMLPQTDKSSLTCGVEG